MEYKILKSGYADSEFEKILNEHSKAGWTVVSLCSHDEFLVALLSRKKQRLHPTGAGL